MQFHVINCCMGFIAKTDGVCMKFLLWGIFFQTKIPWVRTFKFKYLKKRNNSKYFFGFPMK